MNRAKMSHKGRLRAPATPAVAHARGVLLLERTPLPAAHWDDWAGRPRHAPRVVFGRRWAVYLDYATLVVFAADLAALREISPAWLARALGSVPRDVGLGDRWRGTLEAEAAALHAWQDPHPQEWPELNRCPRVLEMWEGGEVAAARLLPAGSWRATLAALRKASGRKYRRPRRRLAYAECRPLPPVRLVPVAQRWFYEPARV